jgi:F-type H+-transporting ATPase subunit b
LEKLGIAPGYLISQIINFGLLVVLLWLLLYKPVLRMLHQRQERIAQAMKDADDARNSAAQAQVEYDKRIAEAQRKAQEVISQAAQTGQAERSQIVAEAQREAEAVREKARAEAQAERERILTEVQGEIAALSMLATERVLGQAVDEKLQHQLISQVLAEMGNRSSTGAAQ